MEETNHAESAHETAYRLIKKAILNPEILSTDTIVEQQLAKQLGLSRTPVREALRILDREGLVTYQKGKGCRISTITENDLREIFEVKLLLEPPAAARAAEMIGADDRNLLLRIGDDMIQASMDQDVYVWLEADSSYHAILLKNANNKRLMLMINNLNDQWWRVRVGIVALRERMAESCEEHLEIAQAVVDGKPSEASEAMRKHLLQVQESVQRALKAAFIINRRGI